MPYLVPCFLLPPVLVPEAAEVTADKIAISACRDGGAGNCPYCGVSSDLVQGLLRRRILDFPAYGRAVQLHVRIRRLARYQ